jgi:hypothetical protein
MIQHRQQNSSSTVGGTGLNGSRYEAGTGEVNIDQVFPAASVNATYVVAFTIAGTQSFALLADKNLTIKTNSSSSPGNTWNLVAGSLFLWSRSDAYFANPISADVTEFFVTCTQAAHLTGKILTA